MIEVVRSVDEAVELALTFEYSAVILRDSVTDTQAMKNKLDPLLRNHNAADLIGDIFPATQMDLAVAPWYQAQEHKPYKLDTGFPRDTEFEEHVDDDFIGPFAASVAFSGIGRWRTQLTALDFDSYANPGAFDPAEPIDSFLQYPGDTVLIPGTPRPSVHEVAVTPDRVSRVLNYMVVPSKVSLSPSELA